MFKKNERFAMSDLDAMAKDVPNGQTLKEQLRRVEVRDRMCDLNETPQFTPSTHDGPRYERRLPEQNWVLYSISSSGLAPISLTPKYPSIRFYGAFAKNQDAIEYSKVVRGVDPHCSLLVHPVGVWGLIAKDAETLAKAPEFIQERIDRYDESLLSARTQFDENVREKRQGETTPHDERDEVVEVKQVPETATAYQQHLGCHARMANQKFAVVSFIRDMQGDDVTQPLFMVHAFFEDTNDADRYVRDTLSHELTEIDVDVVNTGEWISPQTATNHPNCIYRDEELHKIMDNQRKEPGRVARFNNAMASLPAPKRDTPEATTSVSETGTVV